MRAALHCAGLAIIAGLAGGCGTPPAAPRQDDELRRDTQAARAAYAHADPAQAEGLYRAALTRARRIDDRAEAARAAYNLAACLAAQGRYGAARPLLAEARAGFGQQGDEAARTGLLEAQIARAEGKHEEAQVLARAARAAAAGAGARTQARLLLAEAACDAGDPAAAAAELKAGARDLERVSDPGVHAQAEGVRAQLAAAAGKPGAAAAHRDAEANWHRKAGRYGAMTAALTEAGVAYGKAGQPREAAARYYRAARSLLAAGKRGRPGSWSDGPPRRRAWRATPGSAKRCAGCRPRSARAGRSSNSHYGRFLKTDDTEVVPPNKGTPGFRAFWSVGLRPGCKGSGHNENSWGRSGGDCKSVTVRLSSGDTTEKGVAMTTHETASGSIHDRLTRLERQNRRLRALMIGMAAAGTALLLMGARDDQGGITHFKELNAEHIVLRDTDGQMRGWLGIAEGGARLIFFDQSGQQRLGVGMTKEAEPALGVFDGGENQRVTIGMVEGWPGLVFRDPAGKKRMAVYSREDWGSLFFYDRRETKRAGIGLFGDAAAVNLCDDRGKDRTGLTTDPKGSAINFFDTLGMKRAALGIIEKDEPALGLFGEDGQVRAALTAAENATTLSLYGTNRIEAAMSIARTNNMPTVRLYGEERALLWRAP